MTSRNTEPGWLELAFVAACAFGSAACAAPVENEPAYASERFLCGAPNAELWQDAVERCRVRYERDASCAGMISFEGTLEDQPVTLDAEVGRSQFVDAPSPAGPTLRSNVKIYGRTPYFQFTLQLKEIGGEVGGGPRTLQIGGAPQPDELLTDSIVRPSFRMSVGGDSKDLAGQSGELEVERQTEDEEAGAFSMQFRTPGARIDGCFHVFTEERTFETASVREVGP
jgi:hypothetical protein